jgi:hypothetical protein
MSQVFQRLVASVYSKGFISCCKRFDLDVAYVSYICYKSMFQMFQLFQSYVAVSVFMLQVTSVLSGSCICFIRMLQMYVINVSSASDVCCIQVFHVSDVCPESHRGHGLDARAW